MSNPYQTSDTPGGAYPPATGGGSQALAIVSLVSGIMAIFPGCCCGLLGIPLAILALVTGGMVLANPSAAGRSLAMGGVVTGGLALLVFAGLLILSLMNPDFAKQMEQMKQMQQPQMEQNP